MDSHRGYRFSIVVMCVIAALCGCGSQQTAQFIGGDDLIQSHSYQQLADQILADGEVTRAETEQSIIALNQCYEDEGLAGEYGFDLDVYPWILSGRYTLAKTHPESSRETGMEINRAMAVCDAIFNPIEDKVVNEDSLRTALLDKALARYECFVNNAPAYAELFDAVTIRQDPVAATENMIDSYHPDDYSEPERNAIEQCLYYASAQKRTIGGGL